MNASLLAAAGYLLTLISYSCAFLLLLEWFLHCLPGAGLNPLRRAFFISLFPLVSFSEKYLSLDHGRFRSRGLLLGVLLTVFGRFGAPWLVLASFSLRG